MQELPLYNEKQPLVMPPQKPSRQPRSRNRLFITLSLLVAFLWALYSWHTGALPFMADSVSSAIDGLASHSLEEVDASKNMVKLMDLPPSYLPQVGKHNPKERLIVVGDVHGMRESLEELLHKVKFDKKHDHLILAGDMISKGPDSTGVVDLAMKYGATGIRGNHEDRVLATYRKFRRWDQSTAQGEEDDEVLMDSEDELQGDHSEDEVKAAGKRKKDRKLIRQLGKKRLRWLEQCPVILRVGTLGEMGEVVVVHAGLAPGVNLKEQDPKLVMNMRTIKHGVPIEGRDGEPWIKEWNRVQEQLPRHERTTVVYGHDSHKGLRMKKYSMGIDTGCVAGGELTAVVIEGGKTKHIHNVVSVKCENKRN